jgi:hypothetical protein
LLQKCGDLECADRANAYAAIIGGLPSECECEARHKSWGGPAKVVEMVDLSLRIYHHFHDNLDAFAEKAAVFRAIFS